MWSYFWIDFNKFYTKTFRIVYILIVCLLILFRITMWFWNSHGTMHILPSIDSLNNFDSVQQNSNRCLLGLVIVFVLLYPDCWPMVVFFSLFWFIVFVFLLFVIIERIEQHESNQHIVFTICINNVYLWIYMMGCRGRDSMVLLCCKVKVRVRLWYLTPLCSTVIIYYVYCTCKERNQYKLQ